MNAPQTNYLPIFKKTIYSFDNNIAFRGALSLCASSLTERMKEQFARSLRESLRVRYGKLPSAAVLARDFNLRADGVSCITQESARRWMRGEAFPKSEYLEILWTWLGLSLDAAVLTPEKRLPATYSQGIAHGPAYITPMNPAEERITRLFASLSPAQKKAVMELIETCFLNKSGGG
jgi:hypothetical protein